jgi:hypothetical protein
MRGGPTSWDVRFYATDRSTLLPIPPTCASARSAIATTRWIDSIRAEDFIAAGRGKRGQGEIVLLLRTAEHGDKLRLMAHRI